MNLTRPTRILLMLLALAAILTVVALLTVPSGFHHRVIMMDGMDMSDSVLGWMIAIPVMMVVFTVLLVVFAGIGVVMAGVLFVVVGAVLLALLLAFLPFAFFLALPLLALFGLVKLLSPSKAPTSGAT